MGIKNHLTFPPKLHILFPQGRKAARPQGRKAARPQGRKEAFLFAKRKLSIDRIFAIICISVGTVALSVTSVMLGFLLRLSAPFHASGSGVVAINSGHVDGLFTTISAGHGGHSFAIIDNGDLYAWGRNNHGQLGLGIDDDDRLIPTHVSDGGRKYKAISAGGFHTLALAEDGDLYSWGKNDDGQLGLGDTTNRNSPKHVSDGGRKYKAITAGRYNAFAIAENGDLYSWGVDIWGELGIGSPISYPSLTPIFTTPQHVSDGGRKYKAIAAGTYHTLALAENGDLYSWGNNLFGGLGLGHSGSPQNHCFPTPQHVSDGGRKYRAVAAGYHVSLAIAENGDLYSWGWNKEGKLGLGYYSDPGYEEDPQEDISIPQHVSDGGRKYKAVVAGFESIHAIAENGDLYSWGCNWWGELGLGYISDEREHPNTPTHVSDGARKYKAIAKYGWHSIAIAEDGDFYIWGSNWEGELGLGDYDFRYFPTLLYVPPKFYITVTIDTISDDGGVSVENNENHLTSPT